MKIVIVGDGKVGLTLTQQLAKEGHDIVIIDKNPRVLQQSVENYDVISVTGNGASLQVLREAKVDTADLLIAATSADEINLLCCITAKKMGCRHTIARVRNPEYRRQLTFLRDELGLSMTINPEASAAQEIYYIIQFPSSVKRDFFAKGRIEIVELPLKQGCPIIGKKLSELYRKIKVKVLICAVDRNGEVIIPSGDFQLQLGDKIYVTAEGHSLAALIRALNMPTNKIHEVVIIGGSRLAFYLTLRLLAAGLRVKIIEKDYARCQELAEQLPKATIINGDGCDKMLLDSEGVANCDALVSLTGIDEVNLIISMYGNQAGIPKVIAKVDRVEYINIVGHTGVETIISPKNLICGNILRYVRAMNNTSGGEVLSLHRIVDDRVEALEFYVKQNIRHLNIPLKELRLQPHLLIACIRRGGTAIFPTGDDCIKLGDTVIVITTADKHLSRLSDIFV
ncbi:MAG TPA: Trk system potassium transporter TrkA [Candidatus Gallacutalibacter stercoravium]|nr:Trk system potassium transporter TrkA [Candidatus Gallacutalibacter stercoravium]